MFYNYRTIYQFGWRYAGTVRSTRLFNYVLKSVYYDWAILTGIPRSRHRRDDDAARHVSYHPAGDADHRVPDGVRADPRGAAAAAAAAPARAVAAATAAPVPGAATAAVRAEGSASEFAPGLTQRAVACAATAFAASGPVA